MGRFGGGVWPRGVPKAPPGGVSRWGGDNRDPRRSGVETRARRRSSLARALGQGGSVWAVAPAPWIGTAWAPRTSRAAFPVTASAFAIACYDTPTGRGQSSVTGIVVV